VRGFTVEFLCPTHVSLAHPMFEASVYVEQAPNIAAVGMYVFAFVRMRKRARAAAAAGVRSSSSSADHAELKLLYCGLNSSVFLLLPSVFTTIWLYADPSNAAVYELLAIEFGAFEVTWNGILLMVFSSALRSCMKATIKKILLACHFTRASAIAPSSTTHHTTVKR